MKDYHFPAAVTIPAAIGLVGVLWLLRRKSSSNEEGKKNVKVLPEVEEGARDAEEEQEIEHVEAEGIPAFHRRLLETHCCDGGSSDIRCEESVGVAGRISLPVAPDLQKLDVRSDEYIGFGHRTVGADLHPFRCDESGIFGSADVSSCGGSDICSPVDVNSCDEGGVFGSPDSNHSGKSSIFGSGDINSCDESGNIGPAGVNSCDESGNIGPAVVNSCDESGNIGSAGINSCDESGNLEPAGIISYDESAIIQDDCQRSDISQNCHIGLVESLNFDPSHEGCLSLSQWEFLEQQIMAAMNDGLKEAHKMMSQPVFASRSILQMLPDSEAHSLPYIDGLSAGVKVEEIILTNKTADLLLEAPVGLSQRHEIYQINKYEAVNLLSNETASNMESLLLLNDIKGDLAVETAYSDDRSHAALQKLTEISLVDGSTSTALLSPDLSPVMDCQPDVDISNLCSQSDGLLRSCSSTSVSSLADRDDSPTMTVNEKVQHSDVNNLPELSSGVDGFTVEPVDSFSVEPADSFSVEPADSFSIEPADSFSVEPADNNSVEPADNFSVEPADSFSVEPADNFSVEPADSFSVESADSFSVEPADSFSVESADSFSVEPADSFSVESADSFSVKPADSFSVEPADSFSNERADSFSDEPADTSSVEPADTSSVEPADTFSVEPADTSSVEPADTSSVEPADTSSVEPANTSSVEPADTFSVESTEISPVGATTFWSTDSSQNKPTDSFSFEPTHIFPTAATDSSSLESLCDLSIKPTDSSSIEPMFGSSTDSTDISISELREISTGATHVTLIESTDFSIELKDSTSTEPKDSVSTEPANSISAEPKDSSSIEPANSFPFNPIDNSSIETLISSSMVAGNAATQINRTSVSSIKSLSSDRDETRPSLSRWMPKASSSSIDSFGPDEIEAIWGLGSSMDYLDKELFFMDTDPVVLPLKSNGLLDQATDVDIKQEKEEPLASVLQVIDKTKVDDTSFQSCSTAAPALPDKGLNAGSLLKSISPMGDNSSEGSNDSGRGGSDHDIVLPAGDTLIHCEFNIPSEICGQFIGKQGKNINYLKSKTGAQVALTNSCSTPGLQVCSVSGTQTEVDDALSMIRQKFPLQDYPLLTMVPISIPVPIPLQSDSQIVFPEVMQLSLPEGVSVDVFVSAVVDAGQVFVQQPTHRSFMSLEKLNYFLNLVYTQDPNVPSVPLPIECGVICVCESEGFWYRAMTMSLEDENGDVQMKFVDYGGYMTVPVSALKQIRADFMNLPFQAVECFMANIIPNQGEKVFSSEATQSLCDLTQGKLLQCQVVATSEYGLPYIHLYQSNCHNRNSVLINQALVDSRLVRWIEIL